MKYLAAKIQPCTFAALRDVAQPGSAHVWGAWGRKFESCHPDKQKSLGICQGFFHEIACKLACKCEPEKRPEPQRGRLFCLNTSLEDQRS